MRRCRRLCRQAARRDADMLIAVTAYDETNLVACKIAADLYNIPTRIARVRNTELQQHPNLIGEGGFRATQVIFPEQTVTDYLLKLVDFPEALQVLEFADGRASLIAVGRSPAARWCRSRSRNCAVTSRRSIRASSRCFATTPACESTATR